MASKPFLRPISSLFSFISIVYMLLLVVIIVKTNELREDYKTTNHECKKGLLRKT